MTFEDKRNLLNALSVPLAGILAALIAPFCFTPIRVSLWLRARGPLGVAAADWIKDRVHSGGNNLEQWRDVLSGVVRLELALEIGAAVLVVGVLGGFALIYLVPTTTPPRSEGRSEKRAIR